MAMSFLGCVQARQCDSIPHDNILYSLFERKMIERRKTSVGEKTKQNATRLDLKLHFELRWLPQDFYMV